tara:strand:+ start:1160 stop:1615 length:456 start_codon:yes stop_codon:yes gene_type:complete
MSSANNAWNVLPIIKLDENKNPTRCGYLYESKRLKLVLKIEKFVLNEHVMTSISLESPSYNYVGNVKISTKTFDSSKEFKKIESNENQFLAIADLEESISGGMFFYELAIFGGIININNKKFDLPSNLPRETSALYLNCAGDLIRPENEKR